LLFSTALPTPRGTSFCLVNVMRERRYLTFDMNNPRHRKALHLFSAQSDKHRSEFVIDCILKAQQERRIEEVIRTAISETLMGLSLPASDTSVTPVKLQFTEDISDLPEALVCAMDDI
jgi:hypothetical protein